MPMLLCGLISADYAQRELRGTAALHQPGDLVPVNAVGGHLGERPGEPEAPELSRAPFVHEAPLIIDGFVTGDFRDWFHRSSLQPGRYACLGCAGPLSAMPVSRPPCVSPLATPV
jgi:hypothetical protein